MPSTEVIATFYPAEYCVFDEGKKNRRISRLRRALLREARGYSHLPVSFPERILARLLSPFIAPGTPEYLPDGKMLDVGCGNGRYLSTMRTLGWKVQGVELSENGVRVCRMTNLPVHHGDLASAGFPDDSFDLVTVRHVIEHIPEPDSFMAELARILKPGGRLVIETPNSEALGRKWLGVNWYANDIPRHLILFSPKNLALLASRYGLRQAELILETTPKIFLNSLDYLIENRGNPSKRVGWKRFLSRIYVMLAKRSGRGDTQRMTLIKP